MGNVYSAIELSESFIPTGTPQGERKSWLWTESGPRNSVLGFPVLPVWSCLRLIQKSFRKAAWNYCKHQAIITGHHGEALFHRREILAKMLEKFGSSAAASREVLAKMLAAHRVPTWPKSEAQSPSPDLRRSRPVWVLVGPPPGDSGLDSAHLSHDGHLQLCPRTGHKLMSPAQPEL